MNDFWASVIGGLVGGSLPATVITILTAQIVTRAKAEVEDSFKKIVEARFSKRALLEEVLGPACAHLRRTSMAFRRWDKKNLGLESGIILHSNKHLRDLLLAKYHLLPPELREHASSLIEHYDMWLEEYERLRAPGLTTEQDFVFTGPAGYPFPRAAESAFLEAFKATYNELTPPPGGNPL